MRVIICVLPPLIWHISQIIIDFLSLVVSAYVLNESGGISCLSNSWHCCFEKETERIFSLVIILTHLRRCCLQSYNFDKIIFVSKNLPNYFRVGCNSPSSLIKLIEVDLALNEELEQYESEFE